MHGNPKIYLITNKRLIKEVQETRDFDLVALGPPSKVLQEEQGLEVGKICSDNFISNKPLFPPEKGGQLLVVGVTCSISKLFPFNHQPLLFS